MRRVRVLFFRRIYRNINTHNEILNSQTVIVICMNLFSGKDGQQRNSVLRRTEQRRCSILHRKNGTT